MNMLLRTDCFRQIHPSTNRLRILVNKETSTTDKLRKFQSSFRYMSNLQVVVKIINYRKHVKKRNTFDEASKTFHLLFNTLINQKQRVRL